MDVGTVWQCSECDMLNVVNEGDENQRAYCDDCGDHPAIECRLCHETIDLIYTDFENLKWYKPESE
jgi:uncharacterized paraquat-inducible protein A